MYGMQHLTAVCSHLVSSHEEKVNGSNVDTNVLAEFLEDFPDGGTWPKADRRAGAVG